MATGPEHYLEAERLAGLAQESLDVLEYAVAYAALGQLHATLAETAAIAEAAPSAACRLRWAPILNPQEPDRD